MKKPVFFIVFAVIALFTLTTIFGVHTQFGDVVKTYVHGVDDIRLGIDIQGGVDVTFEPAGDVDATEEQMDAALETIKLRLANQIYDEVKRHFQELVFKTIIQRNVKLSEAPSHGIPAILYDADSTGAKNHLALANEIINKN